MFASRSKLALSAFALFAACGVMAAAGPEDMNKRGGDEKWSVRVNIGDSPWHRHERPRPVYGPVCVAPPVITEASPRTLELQAFQAGETVVVMARGENGTAGFSTGLESERDWRNDGVARVVLHNVGPVYSTPTAQVCVPFSVSGSFQSCERLSEVRVWVGGQERCVAVAQIDQMARR